MIPNPERPTEMFVVQLLHNDQGDTVFPDTMKESKGKNGKSLAQMSMKYSLVPPNTGGDDSDYGYGSESDKDDAEKLEETEKLF